MKLTNIFLYIFFLCTCSWTLMAQEQDSVSVKKTKVYLEHANTLSFDQDIKPDAQILVGDVCFHHDSSYMYCDSAYFYEATNSLDANNERIITGNLLDFCKGRTVLIVAHRLSTIRHADRIVVLHKGRIVEEGTHDELCARHGYYYELINNQLIAMG